MSEGMGSKEGNVEGERGSVTEGEREIQRGRVQHYKNEGVRRESRCFTLLTQWLN